MRDRDMIKRVLITGGCGFIGSNLAHHLTDLGWTVDTVDDNSSGDIIFLEGLTFRTCLIDALPLYEEQYEGNDPRQSLCIIGDFAHDNILTRIRRGTYDYVFHTAANPRVSYSVERPAQTTEVNVLKTVGLLKACADAKVKRVVFSSSSAVYGAISEFPTSETAEKNPASPYGLQKLVCEQFADLFGKLYDLDVVSLRYFNVYGPRQLGNSAYSTAISAWCNAVHNNTPLRSDGDGNQTRDMVYVGDVVLANVLAATCPRNLSGEVLNVGTGKYISNNQILELFEAEFGALDISHAPARAGDVKHTHADIRHAETLLGYEPKTHFLVGLRQTWDWWESTRG